MAVNSQQRGLLQVVGNLPRTAPEKFDARMPSSGADAAFDATASTLHKSSEELQGVAETIGRYADHAAQVEGERAGRLAGMDPEFRTTDAITIRGEAYDRAGLEVYKSTVALEIEKDIAGGGNLASKRESWMAKVPEQIRPEVNHMFRRAELTASRSAARAHVERVNTETKTALHDEVDTAVKGLHQRAYALGLDATADDVIGKDIGLLSATLGRKGPDGRPIIAPAAAEKVLRQARDTVTDARLLGAFDRLPDNGARLKFIDQIDDDFRASKGLAKQYDFEHFQHITGRLRTEFRVRQTEERQQAAAVDEEMREIGRMVEKGWQFKPDQIAGVRARAIAVKNPELAARLDVIESTMAFQADMRARRPEEIDGHARGLRDEIAVKGPTPQLTARVELAEKLAHEARLGLKSNQLGWANRVGVVKLAPIDFSTSETTTATLKARIIQAEDVGRHYGLPPVYLEPDEKRKLATIAGQGGDALLGLSGDLVAGGKERATAILGEIGDHAPASAMVGGLVVAAGDMSPPQVARDAADGIALMRTDGYKALAPPPHTARTMAVEASKGTLAGLPRTQQAAIDATNAAYEQRASVAKLKDFNETLWKQTFVEVLGQRKIGGELYGGLAFAKGGKLWGGSGAVIVPPNVKQDGFHDLIRSITPADLGDAWPRDASGRPIDVADFRRASLIQESDGRYRLNIGSEDHPMLLATADKKTFVLDLNALEGKLRATRGEYYLGGGPAGPATRPPGMMKLGGPVPGAPEQPGAYDSGAHDNFGDGRFARSTDLNYGPEDYVIQRNYNRTLSDVVGPGGERWTVDEFINAWENSGDAFATRRDLADAIRAGKLKRPDRPAPAGRMHLGGPMSDPRDGGSGAPPPGSGALATEEAVTAELKRRGLKEGTDAWFEMRDMLLGLDPEDETPRK